MTRPRLIDLCAITSSGSLDKPVRDVIFKTYRDVNIFKGSTRDKLIRACQAALPDQIEIIIRDGICDGELAPADPRRLAWMYVAMGRPTPSEFSETK